MLILVLIKHYSNCNYSPLCKIANFNRFIFCITSLSNIIFIAKLHEAYSKENTHYKEPEGKVSFLHIDNDSIELHHEVTNSIDQSLDASNIVRRIRANVMEKQHSLERSFNVHQHSKKSSFVLPNLNLHATKRLSITKKFPKTTKARKSKIFQETAKMKKEGDLDDPGKKVNKAIERSFKFQDKIKERVRNNLSVLKAREDDKKSKVG